MRFDLSKDNDGQFVPYCEFSAHRGIVLAPYVCEKRQCDYYRKLYLNGIGRVEESKPGNCYESR